MRLTRDGAAGAVAPTSTRERPRSRFTARSPHRVRTRVGPCGAGRENVALTSKAARERAAAFKRGQRGKRQSDPAFLRRFPLSRRERSRSRPETPALRQRVFSQTLSSRRIHQPQPNLPAARESGGTNPRGEPGPRAPSGDARPGRSLPPQPVSSPRRRRKTLIREGPPCPIRLPPRAAPWRSARSRVRAATRHQRVPVACERRWHR